jgi:hypothetical protein
LTTAKTSATTVVDSSDVTIFGRPGRTGRSAYRPDRANSRTVTRYAKATVLRVSTDDACKAHSPLRITALTISAVKIAA